MRKKRKKKLLKESVVVLVVVNCALLQGGSPLFLCLLWKMILDTEEISPLAYKVTVPYPTSVGQSLVVLLFISTTVGTFLDPPLA